jgi:hypothetical protein
MQRYSEFILENGFGLCSMSLRSSFQNTYFNKIVQTNRIKQKKIFVFWSSIY